MNRAQKTMRNSVVNLLGQILAVLLSFISRKILIQYLGMEMLGLKSTFASVLSTLSLAELGFQQVLVFHLYGVMAKDDKTQINALVNIYKVVYRCIGIFYIVAALCCVPFLQIFLSDIEATGTVRIYFIIQALTGACTYFLAYKRNILYADQYSYIAKLIDTGIDTLTTLLSIAIAVYTRSFMLYLLLYLVKTYLSNLFVHLICTRKYPYLHAEKTNWTLMKEIASHIKDVILEKLSVYVYRSTDNLLISMFISTIQVGLLGNYTMIINQVKTLIRSISNPIIPAIGHMVATDDEQLHQLHTFRLLEQVYFWLSGLVVIPLYRLLDTFVQLYFGEQFLMPGLVLLLCVDLYIHINQDVSLSFLNANGQFRKRRNIAIGGAIINMVVSLLLMKPLGIKGILLGTAVSQMYYWFARSRVVLRECLHQDWQMLLQYWLRQASLLCIIVVSAWSSGLIAQNLFVLNAMVTFLVNIALCEICFVILAFVCCRGMEAERRLERIVIEMLLKLMRRKA